MAKDFTTGVVRDRGQLTIPDSLRSQLPWLANSSVVFFSISDPEVLTVTPHTPATNEDLLWNSIKLVRSFKTTGASVAQQIREDRDAR